jgi:hypothetical protein
MTHLTDVEIVDFVEDALAPARAAHLETCDGCRRRAQDARDALARAIESDVPEPSPLYWERFSDRVRDGIRDTTPGAAGWRQWLDHAGLRWALSGALVLAVIAGAAWRVMAPTMSYPPASSQPAPPEAPSAAPASAETTLHDVSVDADPAWAVVRTLADDVPWSDSVDVGLAARPDAADRVADTLTARERSELLQLLQAEIKQPGE